MPNHILKLFSPPHQPRTSQEESGFDPRRRVWRFAALLPVLSALNSVTAEDSALQSVPLSDDGILIRVPVRVFGETLYFMVDTGCSLSALDTQYAGRLGQPVDTYRTATPIAEGNAMPIYRSPDLTIGGRSLDLREIGTTDLSMARWVSGEPCDGILGMDFFAHAVVTLDFDRKVFSVSDAVPSAVANASTVLHLRPLLPHWTATVVLNQTHSADLMVDTGDSGSLSLNKEDWQAVFSASQAAVASQTIGALSGQVAEEKIGRIDVLSVAGLSFTNLHATRLPNPGIPSNLGLKFFKRHRVTFAFQQAAIYLRPGNSCAGPDREDMSGLHLLRIEGQTVVHSVDSGSPADRAGLLPNDTIGSVNQREAASTPMRDIRELLSSREGAEVSLGIMRGHERLTKEFALKRTL